YVCGTDTIISTRIMNKPGQYIGYFDISDPSHPIPAPSTSGYRKAELATFLWVEESVKNLLIRNIEFFGNATEQNIGYSPLNLSHIGLRIYSGKYISLE